MISASINVAKIDKSKLIDGKKGKYLNLTIWLNDEPDQFGNDVSIQQSLTKEERESGAEKIYLGNGKLNVKDNAPQAVDSSDIPF